MFGWKTDKEGHSVVEVYRDFKEYRVSFGCKGICETTDLTTVPKRYKGYTAQEAGIKYCKRCEKHFKPEAGLRCPCCKQRLKCRIRSKQSRRYRELIQKLIGPEETTE